MIDTHCHLDAQQFDEDRNTVLQRAFDAGVEKILVPAIAAQSFASVLQLAESDERIYCAIGIHPHKAVEWNSAVAATVERYAADRKVRAVGEIGLDYYYDFCSPDVQKRAFRDQLAIARNTARPVIVHNRESTDDVLKIVHEEQDGRLQGVFHCFSQDSEVLRQVLDLGFHVSFTGNITFKKSTLNPIVEAVPENRFMLETDGPYMAPVPHRGKRNEPAFLRLVAEKIAQIRSTTFNEVVAMTTKTAEKLFRLALLALAFPLALHAQSSDEDYYYDEEEAYYEEDEFKNPYDRFIGFGPSIGTNTIVETVTESNGSSFDISYEGLFTIGGTVSCGITDNFLVQVSYLYAKNNKVVESGDQVNPNTHQLVDLSLYFTPNPYNRINFYGIIGPSYFANKYDDRDDLSDTHVGINFGLALMGNIPTSVGLITPVLEWKVSLITGERRIFGEERSFFSSIPRFNLIYYPAF